MSTDPNQPSEEIAMLIKDMKNLGYNEQNITTAIKDINKRLSWIINSFCLIYSRKMQSWCNAQIIDIYTEKETNQQWLTVKYNKKSKKKIQRFCKDIKPTDFQYNNNNHYQLIKKIINYVKNNNIDLSGIQITFTNTDQITSKAHFDNIEYMNDLAIAIALSTDDNDMQNDDLAIAIALSMNTYEQHNYNADHNKTSITLHTHNKYSVNNYEYVSLTTIDSIVVLSHHESELFFTGFIRAANIYCITQIFPLDVIKLCFKYFFTNAKLKQLNEERENALILNDMNRIFELEKAMLAVICNTKYSHNNEEMLSLILNNWNLNEKIQQYRKHIVMCTRACIGKHNVNILKNILKCCSYDAIYKCEHYDNIENKKRRNEIMEFVKIAAKTNAFECIKLLFKHPNKLDWSDELHPIVLFNAVKYQHMNINLIHFIIDCLEQTKIRFICNDVMEEIIRYDLVEIGKRVVNNRWHQINEYDKSFAKFINLKCHKWIIERSDALNYYSDSINDEMLTLDDDEWENLCI